MGRRKEVYIHHVEIIFLINNKIKFFMRKHTKNLTLLLSFSPFLRYTYVSYLEKKLYYDYDYDFIIFNNMIFDDE